MSVRIRLTRLGSKKRPFYRIVAMDSQTRRDGRALEYLGYYNPMVDPEEISINKEGVQKWLDQGAIPSDTVKALLRKGDQTGGKMPKAPVQEPPKVEEPVEEPVAEEAAEAPAEAAAEEAAEAPAEAPAEEAAEEAPAEAEAPAAEESEEKEPEG
jgi:small subunit ribosomal protein S16